MGAATPAFAQSSEVGDAAVEGDTIIVSGFRQSLENALNTKRNSGNIVDAISAEDIGKSTDQNIAEALQRVTGVSINRDEGEGTTVSVRGIGGALNNVTLNGVPLTSSGGDQSVNFSEFSADILQAIEVQKTPSANTDEGSLGATVKLVGFRPLNRRKDRRSFTLQGRYSDFSENLDYKASLALSEKFFDNRVGVSIVATRETQSGRSDFINHPWRSHNNFRNGANQNGTEVVREYDVNGDGVAESGELAVWSANPMQYRYDRYDRDRDTVQAGLQFKLWEGSDILLTSTYSNQKLNRDRSFIQAPTYNNNVYSDVQHFDPVTRTLYQNIGVNLPQNPLASTLPFGPITNETRTNLPVRDRAPIGAWRHGRDVFKDTQENWVHSFDIKQELGEFTLNLKGGRSDTRQKDGEQQRSFWRLRRVFGFGGAREPLGGSNSSSGYVCDNPSGNLLCRIVQTPGDPDFVVPDFPNNFDLAGTMPFADQSIGLFDNAVLFEPQQFSTNNRFGKDIANSVYFDVQWDHQFGPISGFEFGGKWSDRKKEDNSQNNGCNVTCLREQIPDPDNPGQTISGDPILPGVFLSNFSDGSAPSNFAEALGYARDQQTDGWPLIDINAMADLINGANAAGLLSTSLDPLQQRTLEQEVYGGYFQANLDMFGGRLFGDIGIRYAKTKVAGTGPSLVDLNDAQGFVGSENICAIGGYCEDFDGIPTTQPDLDLARAATEAVMFPLVGLPRPGESRNGQSASFLATETNEYENWLPSLNLNWLMTDDIIVRFAASETIARPRINDLYPRFEITELIFSERSNARLGGTSLRPFKSRNLDLSVEWYFDTGSLLSVAIFNKDLKDFVQNSTFESFYVDPRALYWDVNNLQDDPERAGPRAVAFTVDEVFANGTEAPNSSLLIPFDGSGFAAGCMPNRENDLTQAQAVEFCDVVRVTTVDNGTGGYVRGVEVGLTHSFSNWSGFWGGLGFQLNYTYADSRQDEQVAPTGVLPEAPFENTSEHTYNATVFWEKEGSLVRVAYSGRTDYMINRVQNDFTRWAEGIDSLDVSANWKINNQFSLNFQAINLLDAVTRTYETVRQDVSIGSTTLPAESSVLGQQYRGRTSTLSNTGRIFRLGLRFDF